MIALAIGAAVVLLTGSARADVIWNWSFSLGTVTAGGTLTTNDLSGDSYLITGISGTWNGTAITALLVPGTCCSTPPNDNLLLDASTQLDAEGFAFDPPGLTNENIYFDSFNTNSYSYTNGSFFFVGGTFSPVIASSSIPEPASLAIFTTGLIGLGILRRRRARFKRDGFGGNLS